MRRPSAVLLSLLVTATLAAQGAWSPHTDTPGFGIGGRVFALGTWRNELIAGTYRSPWRDGSSLEHLGRFDGVRWRPLGQGVNGHVRTALEFQGDLYVGGAFGIAGGVTARGVARFDGTRWTAVGAGLNGEVWALCEHRGELYAIGDFVASGPRSVLRIARFDGTQWQPVGGGLQWVYGVNALPRAMVSDGTRLYVGGDFDRAGTTVVGNLAQWDGSSWRAVGSGAQTFTAGYVRALAVHAGALYVGGMGMQAGAVTAEGLIRWNGTNWAQVGAGVQGTIYTGVVESLEVWRNELYVAGSFNLSGATDLDRIARFDGTQLVPIGGVDVAEFNPPTIFAMTVWNDRLWCGGEFHVAGQARVIGQAIGVYHVASFDGTRWRAAGDGLGFDNEVHVLGRYRGQTVAGGRFGVAGGKRVAGLARFDGDDWQAFGTFDGLVKGLVEHNGELWVAGEFYTVDGIQADGVARFDGTRWHAVGGGPGPYRADSIASYQGMIHIGRTGSPLRWNGSAWQSFCPPISGIITAMHVHQGVLYMGGSTPFHAGAPNLFAWDGTTLRVPGGGVNGSVQALGSFNGELIVGGRFTSAGTAATGGTVAARSIARWNGTSWSTFGIGIRGATVLDIDVFRGELVVGGDFSRFQGENADYVARWNGTSWQPFGGEGPNGAVFALLPDDARGELHVGGWYFRIGARDASYYGLWQTTPAWTDLGSALGTARRTPFLAGDGSLLPGARTRWRLSSARENAPLAFVMGFARADLPAFGGTLVPRPDLALGLGTDGIGALELSMPWLPGLNGVALWSQAWILDPDAAFGFSASNAVLTRAP